MVVAATSIESYNNIYNLTGKRLEVYNALKDIQPASNQAIADYLGWPINRVTGRVTELRDMELVEKGGVKKGKFGAKVNTWRLKQKEKAAEVEPEQSEPETPETIPMFDMPVAASPPKKRWRKERAFK